LREEDERVRFVRIKRCANFLLQQALFETRESRVNCLSRVSPASEKNLGNKQKEAGIILATGLLSPLPPCLAGHWAQPTDRPAAPLFFAFTAASRF
jgi:hypothetical protein